MKQSSLFSTTYKDDPKDSQEVNHKLFVRGGYIDQVSAGVWSFLPLGFRVMHKIMHVIREEINATGAQEIFLPTLIPRELWEKAGRWETIDPPLFRLKDRHRHEYGLGSTHEEVITDLASKNISSHKQLPLAIYQLQTKFRNEVRAMGGLLRTREFMMKDMYSFHADEKSLGEYYARVREAYLAIFKRCGLTPLPVRASGGTIGGSETHEFMIEVPSGEDTIVLCSLCGFAANVEVEKSKKCPECGRVLEERKSIEAGHIFKLGTKYSKAMQATYTDAEGKEQPMIMGCYGIGVGRLMASIVEVNHDEKGIIWPKEVAPFHAHLLDLTKSEQGHKRAEALYSALQKAGIEVLYDDREEAPGAKFADTDLIGIPVRLVVGDKQPKHIEWKERSKTKTDVLTAKEVQTRLEQQFA